MNKDILRLAIPNILANLSVPLLSAVDMALMGHQDESGYILSVGFGVMIFSFIYWSFGFLRMGVTGMTAQEVGKENNEETLRLLFRGLLCALISSLLIILFKDLLLKGSLHLIDSEAHISQQITTYFNIRIYAAPATLVSYVFIGWFLGKQNAKLPMVMTILVNAFNVTLSYYFVTVLKLTVSGVAYGTLLAQYAGLVIPIFYLLYVYKNQINRDSIRGIAEVRALYRFVRVNLDIFIRTLCLILTFSFFKIASGWEGELIGAANMLLLEFVTMAAYTIDGFAFAAEALSGKYFGAKNRASFNKVVRLCFVWGIVLGVLYSLLYLVFGKSILSILTSQTLVIAEALNYLPWLVLFPVFSAIAFIWDGIYIGTTSSKAMRNTMVFSTFVIFIPSYYLFSYLYGSHGLWLSLLLFLLARGVSQTVLSRVVIFTKLGTPK